jgi:hypothetical protein
LPEFKRETDTPFEMARCLAIAAEEGMSTLDSILSLLEKWPAWKRIKEAPTKIEQLEGRISELESKLRRAPGEACPSCGAWEFRAIKSMPHHNPAFAHLGAVMRKMKCGQCGFEETTNVSKGNR